VELTGLPGVGEQRRVAEVDAAAVCAERWGKSASGSGLKRFGVLSEACGVKDGASADSELEWPAAGAAASLLARGAEGLRREGRGE